MGIEPSISKWYKTQKPACRWNKGKHLCLAFACQQSGRWECSGVQCVIMNMPLSTHTVIIIDSWTQGSWVVYSHTDSKQQLLVKRGMWSEEAAAAEFQAFLFGPPQNETFGQTATTILMRNSWKHFPPLLAHQMQAFSHKSVFIHLWSYIISSLLQFFFV